MATKMEEIARIGSQVSKLSDSFIELIHQHNIHPMAGIAALLCAIKTLACVAPNPENLDEVKELVGYSNQELARMKFEDNKEYRLIGRGPTN